MAKNGIIRLIDGQQGWLDPTADALQSWVQRAYDAGGETGQRAKNVLSGTWLGHPLHPVLTDLPIGAWTAALLFDLLDANGEGRAYARAADAAVGLGLVGAVGAAVTGLSDWHFAVGRPRRVGLAHGLLNTVATSLYAGSLAARAGGARGWGRALAGLGYGVASLSAYLGGDLVYHQRLGVDHAPEAAPERFVAVLRDAELPEGRPRRAEADGIAVMLVRQGGRVYALAESCAHLGGPLSEGELREGCIVCPWHGSRFALRDGSVLDGPSTFDQPCYRTRVRDGMIEVGPAVETPAVEAPEAGARPGLATAGEVR